MANSLNLNVFGLRVLEILVDNKSRLSVAGDVLLYVGKRQEQEQENVRNCDSCLYWTQEMIDSLSDDAVHTIIGKACRQCRFERWQERKRELARDCADLIDFVVSPIVGEGDDASELDDAKRVLLRRFRVELGEVICGLIESGYSVIQIAEKLGCARDSVNGKIRYARKMVS